MKMVIVLFIVSVLPVFLVGLFIYKKDRQKEPAKLLVKLFFGGICSVFLVTIISEILEFIFPIFAADIDSLNLIELFIFVFIGVALVEEFSKLIMVYIISYNDKNFDEFYDAILYCVFGALGFACLENLKYVFYYGIGTGLLRAVLAIPGHACNGMFMGYYLGLSKLGSLNNRNDIKTRNLILSILVPTITHGIYDYCLFSKVAILYLVFFVFVICMYIYAIKKIKKISLINIKMKYKDNYCPNCGHIVDGNFCPICGRKNE